MAAMANNQTQAPKDASLQEEERLEDALDYLNELHVQASQDTHTHRLTSPYRPYSNSPSLGYSFSVFAPRYHACSTPCP